MVGLLHYITFVPGRSHLLVAALSGPSEGWLGGTALDADRRLLLVRPDGLLPDPAATVEVLIAVGLAARTRTGALRRLSFEVLGLSPEVRCDLEITPARASGCRLRLRGEWRPSLDAGQGRDEAEVLEAVARPLVDGLAALIAGSTLLV